MRTDTERFAWLAAFKCNSFSLSRDDDHATNYTTAAKWIDEFDPDAFNGVDPAEIQRMKDTNTIWRLQIYVATPVGFVVFFGATAAYVIDAAMEALSDH